MTMPAFVIGKDHPVRVTSDGTVHGSRVEFRGEDGAWHKLPGVTRFSVGIDASKGDAAVEAHLTIIGAEVCIETENVVREES
jgi:hypothetical protein